MRKIALFAALAVTMQEGHAFGKLCGRKCKPASVVSQQASPPVYSKPVYSQPVYSQPAPTYTPPVQVATVGYTVVCDGNTCTRVAK